MKRLLPVLACTALEILFSGCSSITTAHAQKAEMMSGYLSGSTDSAESIAEQKLEDGGAFSLSAAGTGDELMWRLESGTLHYLTGRYEAGIRDFERGEELIREYDNRAIINLRSFASEGAGVLTNPNALPYRAYARDRVLLPVFKAFCYLGKNDEEGFRVELFRLRENQQEILSDESAFFKAEDQAVEAEKKKNQDAAQSADAEKILADPYNQELKKQIEVIRAHKGYADYLNPFATFMSAYGYLRDFDSENAIVDFERLHKAVPENTEVRRYYAELLRRTNRTVPDALKKVRPHDFSLERRNVLVIYAAGRSAALNQTTLYLPIVLPGYINIVPIAWPVCEFYDPAPQPLKIQSDHVLYQTVRLADMDSILAQEYSDRLPGTITRIALSTAAKETASYFATRAASDASTGAGIAVAIGAAAYKSFMNTADTRTWEVLPKEFQIIQFAMPQNRALTLFTPSGKPLEVRIPVHADSAILYVNAPGNTDATFSYRLFTLGK